MSILIYAESAEGKFKKVAFELASYGKKVADLLGTQCVALTLGTVNNAGELGRYGAGRVLGAPFGHGSDHGALEVPPRLYARRHVGRALRASGARGRRGQLGPGHGRPVRRARLGRALSRATAGRKLRPGKKPGAFLRPGR